MSSPAFLQGILSHERPLFTKVAGAVLDGGMEHRPDPKSRSTPELLEHIIGHPLDLEELLADGVIHHRNQVPFDSVQNGVERLDGALERVIDRLGTMTQDEWMAPAQFLVGDTVIVEGPLQNLAWMVFLDSVHHRGQLSTHLRAMGSTVPSIYGPSGDDQGSAH